MSEKRRSELAGRLRISREASERDYNPCRAHSLLHLGAGNEERLQPSLASGLSRPPAWHEAHRASVSNHCPDGAQMAAPLSAARSARPPRTLPRPPSPARQNSCRRDSKSSLSVNNCPPSGLAASSASSISPSATAPWSASGAPTACSIPAAESINANKTWPTSKPPGVCSSRSPLTPRTSTISPTTGPRPRPSICPSSNTLPARCAAACSSSPLPSAVLLPPAPCSPPASSNICNAMGFRSAI